MEEVTLNDYVVIVDKEKTLALYSELPQVSDKAHCGCEDCQLFAKQILNSSPQILKFFEQFGINPTKEAEVWRAVPNVNGFDTYSADYHFIGFIEGTDDLDWIQIEEASFGLANHDGDLPSPMIPITFQKPIVELAVRITMPHEEI